MENAKQVGEKTAYRLILAKTIELLSRYNDSIARCALTELGDYVCALNDDKRV